VSVSLKHVLTFAVAPALLLGAVACSSNSTSSSATKAPTVSGAPAAVSTVQGSPGASTAGAQALAETATDNKFSNTSFDASANKPIALTLTNKGAAVHNWKLTDVKDASGKDIKTALLDPNKSETATFTIAKPGTYHFNCEVHPDEMKGTLTIK
jgi:plastocyanin